MINQWLNCLPRCNHKWQCNAEANNSHHSHQKHEFHRVTVEFKIYRSWIEDISDQASLCCQESSAFYQSVNFFISNRPRLNHSSSTGQRMLSCLSFRVNLFRIVRQTWLHDWNTFPSQHRFVHDCAASEQNQVAWERLTLRQLDYITWQKLTASNCL